jgi:hypothetical protein
MNWRISNSHTCIRKKIIRAAKTERGEVVEEEE